MSIGAQIEELSTRSSNYLLLHRFYMPMTHGSVLAISVTTEVSKILLSLYALMVNVMILQAWYLIVLVGMTIFARHKKLTNNMGVANVAIWNNQSPLSVIWSMFTYRAHIPGYALSWAALAAIAWAGNFAASLLVSPHLILGPAAPVNPAMVSIPAEDFTDFSSKTLRIASLEVPSNLRAIDVLDSVNSTTGAATDSSSYLSQFNVTVGSTRSSIDANGNLINQVDYAYQLSGNDFGLQRAQGLRLDVHGSCSTAYDWYIGNVTQDLVNVDVYNIFGQNYSASETDGKPPIVTAIVDSQSSGSNISFAMLISSVGRLSFTAGSDPWYQTQAYDGDPNGAKYVVASGRPPLSCWQDDVWSYKEKSTSINDIAELNILSPAIIAIFQRFLSEPRVISLAQALDASALKSAGTAKGLYFDAGASKLHDDLQRLVLGAYVATKNTLSESVLFNNPYDDIPNLLLNGTVNQILPGVGDFVIYGSDFAALSVAVLAAIPILMALLWATVTILTGDAWFPLPWSYVNALKAPVLYSSLGAKSDIDVDHDRQWKRTSVPYYEDKGALVQVRPKYDKRSRTLSWESRRADERENKSPSPVQSTDNKGEGA